MKSKGFYFMLVVVLLYACKQDRKHAEGESDTRYTCPMHPQVIQNQPGTCPICKMDLVKVEPTNSSRLMLSENGNTLGDIQILTIRSSINKNTRLLNARVVRNESKRAVVSARFSGRVERIAARQVGENIRKGQVLAELYTDDLSSLQREFLASLDDEILRLSAERKMKLLGMTMEDINKVRSSKKPLATISLRATSDGVLDSLLITAGKYVREGDELFRLVSLGSLRVEAEDYLSEGLFFAAGDTVTILENSAAKHSSKAVVLSLNPELRSGSQVKIIRLEMLANELDLFPGARVQVQASVADKSRTILVPSEAIIHSSDGAHVWIQDGDQSFRPQVIEIGSATEQSTEVLKGLIAGDRLVVRGSGLLESASVQN